MDTTRSAHFDSFPAAVSLAAADLANCTTMGLSFMMKPLVSFNANSACLTFCKVTKAWPFILPSCIKRISNLNANETVNVGNTKLDMN